MKALISGLCIVLLLSGLLWSYHNKQLDIVSLINNELANTPSSAGKATFDLLDATQFDDSMYPWLGFPVVILSETDLFGVGFDATAPLDEIRVKQVLLKYKDQKRLILNIPGWQITSGVDSINKNHVKNFLQLIKCVREALPQVDVGVFGMPYSPWDALKSEKSNMAEYLRTLDNLKPVIDVLDTLYPLFQVKGEGESDFSYLMGVQLYIAKTYGKPVYPIASHNAIYSEDNKKLIPVNLIKQQCEFIRKNANGMVWWAADKDVWEDHWYDEVANICFI